MRRTGRPWGSGLMALLFMAAALRGAAADPPQADSSRPENRDKPGQTTEEGPVSTPPPSPTGSGARGTGDSGGQAGAGGGIAGGSMQGGPAASESQQAELRLKKLIRRLG